MTVHTVISRACSVATFEQKLDMGFFSRLNELGMQEKKTKL